MIHNYLVVIALSNRKNDEHTRGYFVKVDKEKINSYYKPREVAINIALEEAVENRFYEVGESIRVVHIESIPDDIEYIK